MGNGSQREFDFNRASQLAALRDATLPAVPQVSGGALKATLRAIDDFARADGECFATAETLAGVAGVGLRTIKRALSALVSLSLVTCERKRSRYGTANNHYRIVWSELALLSRRERAAGAPDQRAMVALAECHGGTLQRAMVSDQRAMVSDQRAMVALAECHGGTQTVLNNRQPTAKENVVAAAVEVGVVAENAANAVDVATARGVEAAELLALVDHYRRHRDAYRSPGVLVSAFRTARPGGAAGDAFPPAPDAVDHERLAELRNDNRRALARAIAHEGRRSGLPTEEIGRRLVEAGLSLDLLRGE